MLINHQLADGRVGPAAPGEGNILHFVAPDAEERRRLLDEFRLDEHTLNSALDPDELSRLEFEPEHIALIYKQPKNYTSSDQLVFKVLSVGIFLFAERIVIVSAGEVPLFDGKLFNRVGSLTELLLKLVFRSVYHFLDHLKVITMITDELERKLVTSMGNQNLLNLFALEKSLVYYLNAINSNSALVERLKFNASKLGLSRELTEILEDMGIENSQCYRQAEIHSNILASLMDARASIVDNNLNTIMKRLTVISIVFMPLNMLAGIGGMSEFSMMTKNIPWPISYGLFGVGLGLIGALTYFMIRNMGSGRGRRGG